MLIRSITQGDKEAFYQLARDFYADGGTLFSLPQCHLDDTFTQAVEGSPFLNLFLLFEEKEGQVLPAGYAHLAFTWTLEAGGKVCWLEEIYIVPEFRDRGLAKAFIRWMFDTYQGSCRRFRLEVCPDKEKAQKLYAAMGFIQLPYFEMYREVPRSPIQE